MLNAKLSSATTLKKAVDGMKELTSDVSFDFSKDEGLRIQTLDTAHTALIDFQLRPTAFKVYKLSRNMTLGISLPSLANILKCASVNDELTIRKVENADVVTVELVPEDTLQKSKFDLKLMQLEQDGLAPPVTDYPTMICMSSTSWAKIVQDLTQFGENITLQCSGNSVKFKVLGDMVNTTMRLEMTDSLSDHASVIIYCREPCNVTFSSKFIQLFSKSHPLSKWVQLSTGDNVPICVEFKLEENEECYGHMKYFLAPKVDDQSQ